jgi:hypothetical protein
MRERFLLIVVDNFNVISCTLTPCKANPPLIIDADAVLSLPVAAQLLQPITRRLLQITQLFGVGKLKKFAIGNIREAAKPSAA